MAQAPGMPVAKEANPAPLGLAGFALTTLILSLVNSGLVSGSSLAIVVGLALAYGGLGQLIAGWWEFKNGNTFGAVAFSSYGGFWVSFAAFVLLFQGKDAGNAVAWYLLGWGIFTFYMWIASLKGARPVMIVFLLLWITFVLLALGGFANAAPGAGLTQIGGYVGLVTAVAAFYASARGVINESWGSEILPG
ncbi:MAG: acetate uptake transporter [Candidatus Limnocylindrales bacterium]